MYTALGKPTRYCSHTEDWGAGVSVLEVKSYLASRRGGESTRPKDMVSTVAGVYYLSILSCAVKPKIVNHSIAIRAFRGWKLPSLMMSAKKRTPRPKAIDEILYWLQTLR